MKNAIIILLLASLTASAQTYVTLTISNYTQVASVTIPPGDVVKVLNYNVIPSGAALVPAEVTVNFTNGVTVPYGVSTLSLNSAANFFEIMPLGSPLAGVQTVTLQANAGAGYDINNSAGFCTLEIDGTNQVGTVQSVPVTLSISPAKVIAVNGSPSGSVLLQSSTDFASWENVTTGQPPFIFTDTTHNPVRFYRAVNQ
jgi:hypothetical protein